MPRWQHAHPNSLYMKLCIGDPERKRAYNRWLTEISADVSAMNAWARRELTEPRRFQK